MDCSQKYFLALTNRVWRYQIRLDGTWTDPKPMQWQIVLIWPDVGSACNISLQASGSESVLCILHDLLHGIPSNDNMTEADDVLLFVQDL